MILSATGQGTFVCAYGYTEPGGWFRLKRVYDILVKDGYAG